MAQATGLSVCSLPEQRRCWCFLRSIWQHQGRPGGDQAATSVRPLAICFVVSTFELVTSATLVATSALLVVTKKLLELKFNEIKLTTSFLLLLVRHLLLVAMHLLLVCAGNMFVPFWCHGFSCLMLECFCGLCGQIQFFQAVLRHIFITDGSRNSNFLVRENILRLIHYNNYNILQQYIFS